MPVLNTVLRRRMLMIYLAALSVLYAAAILTAGGSDIRGEWISAALSILGLAVAVPRPLCGWRHNLALFCACTAPLSALIGHRELAAQVWALIPLILIAVFIRSWHRPVAARAAAVALGAAAVAGLLIAPAPVPALWLVLFPVCIIGAAEVHGVLHAALVDAALRDPLTGVWNRAGLNRALDDLLPRARRRGEQLAVIVLDIDDFKAVNDRHGHAAGDTVLVDLTRRWQTLLPGQALIGRLGGDEFVAIVAGLDNAATRQLADALGGHGPVRVSTGVAVGAASGPGGFAPLLAAADRDLYQSKADRKNASCPDEPPGGRR